MKKLIVPLLVLASGCASHDIAKINHELAGDPAVVVARITSIYGTLNMTRVGGTNRTVTVSPDGNVTVGTVPPAR